MKIYLRTLIKGIIWELIGVVIMFLACLATSTAYSIIYWYFLIRILLYFIYHRLFKKIKFNSYIETSYVRSKKR